MPLYVIDTIISYRLKYAIEAQKLEHAMDELVMTEHNRDFNEITQRCLGEQIIEGREVTRDELHTMMQQFTNDPGELSSYWMGDKLIKTVDYEDSTRKRSTP